MPDSKLKYLWIFYNLFVCALALIWRRLLFRTKVIAISGSVGKTTAKDCLALILARRFPIVSTIGTFNGRNGIPRTILRARPWHRFVIVEAGIQKPGRMWRSAWLLKPDVVVMLRVAMTHPKGFDSLDVVAHEKAKLLDPLSQRGVAILDGDDARVAAMAKGRPFEVIRFGYSDTFDVWADEVSATWPDRLRFRVHAGDKTQWIQTQLVGAHWVPSVLAAITAALHCGVSMEDAANALAGMQPVIARMQPVDLHGGATMIRDEYNGSLVTAWPALQVLKTGKAQRKLVVLACYDGEGGEEDAALPVAREMAGFADIAIVVGSHSEAVCRTALAAGMSPQNLLCAESLPETAEILRRVRRQGDLVLLRGLWDWHMSRVYFAQLGSVACWKTDCQKVITCDNCWELGFRPFERALGAVADAGPQTTTLRVGRGHSSSG